MRTFVAIEISNDDVKNAIKNFQKNLKIDAKSIDVEQLHFTLQFLGEISEELAQKVMESLQTIKFSEFTINLKGVGAFPKPRFPRVVWIGTDKEGGENLIELAKKVQNVLKPLGLISDKPFKPHITVFRIKKKIGDITKELNKQRLADFGIQKISSIKLKKSELTSNGPIYSDIEEVAAVK
ncbi:2'-5' RNA ligase protein [Marine Group I thaumarchaeote SCGC AAA799-E16]|uniref:RNA 2',3'-cyclic phosphodiesterase n=4 Tax=Marine Group I TaxID=905826 RepID=A0A081RN04_9ARCH|nr:2'-5' RNA ligase protein [Marine Group I thaumarchaeote SCGC AAA799-N04]KER06798.1 2'-5' RNA ligase protein [Marine Group I thaumarchaeote SCGC AAA799-E16]KFM14361.1 2'-5' RNA ligase protein [Marine Group I thaumarchaeote SCGC AAA799-D11]